MIPSDLRRFDRRRDSVDRIPLRSIGRRAPLRKRSYRGGMDDCAPHLRACAPRHGRTRSKFPRCSIRHTRPPGPPATDQAISSTGVPRIGFDIQIQREIKYLSSICQRTEQRSAHSALCSTRLYRITDFASGPAFSLRGLETISSVAARRAVTYLGPTLFAPDGGLSKFAGRSMRSGSADRWIERS